MTYEYESTTPSTSSGSSTAQTARDEASNVAHSAAQTTQQLAGEAKSQAKDVAAEAGRQTKDLLAQGRDTLRTQASDQQKRLAGGIRTFGSQLQDMAGAAESGMAADVARTVADRSSAVASWFESREPEDVLEEVKEFARRRPGTFLAIAAGVGLLAGRLTRGVKDASTSPQPAGYLESSTAAHRAPGAASTPATLAGSAPLAGGAYAEPTTTAYTEPTAGTYAGAQTTPEYGSGTYGSGTYGSDAYGSGTVGGATPVTGTAASTPLEGEYGGTATGEPTYGLEREEDR